MSSKLKALSEAPWFQNFIIGVILFAGVIVGFETYPSFATQNAAVLHAVDKVIIWIFVAEILVKVGAEGSKPWRYFADGWNIFDFIIVAVCFLPLDAQFFAVLRLARLLRVLRLVRALPKLQVLVGALLKSVPSMGYVGLLLFLLFYLYAVLGTFMFHGNDPAHFATLPRTFLTLYETATFEGWVDVMAINFNGCEVTQCAPGAVSSAHGWGAAAYFVSFTILATMVILNLFIGVIVGGMEEAQQELAAAAAKKEAASQDPMQVRLEQLTNQLEQLHKDLRELTTSQRAA